MLKRNKTVERQLKKHKKSMTEAAGALMLGASGVAPAPTVEQPNEPCEGGVQQPAAFLPPVLVVADAGGLDAVTDIARGSGAGGCAPFDMRAGREKSQR